MEDRGWAEHMEHPHAPVDWASFSPREGKGDRLLCITYQSVLTVPREQVEEVINNVLEVAQVMYTCMHKC